MPTKKNRRLTPEKQKKVYNDWLLQAYPALFNAHRLPMAMGIFEQLSDHLPEHISKTDLRATLGWYASRVKYLHNLCSHENRLNLDGTVAGQITAAEKAAAAQKIKVILQAKKLLVAKSQKMP
jgi:sRNA-binding protein